MTRIRCETRQGISAGNVVAGVGDVYEHRHFMLVDRDFLADALEEAGCIADILGHFREPGAHVRGCWPLDLLLGKK